MFSFDLATADEIGLELAKRLRSHRLAQNLGQTELAARAGVSRGTVQNLEAKGQASLESLLKIVTALGLAGSLSELLRPTSIKEMETTSAGRMRATGAGR
jgi:transcriptional regulator with XRE-family HTH domain